MNENKKVSVKCPECDNDFELDVSSLQVGDIVECPVCGASLEVISAEPLLLEPITISK